MFIPILVGGVLGVLAYLWYYSPRYAVLVDQYAPHPVPPESRLPMAAVGGVIFTVALFWFGWTSYPNISYWSPLMSGVLLGFGIEFVFVALFNYIMCVLRISIVLMALTLHFSDAYLFVSASALASCTVVRRLLISRSIPTVPIGELTALCRPAAVLVPVSLCLRHKCTRHSTQDGHLPCSAVSQLS
jgi:hypothetical protein